jgi:hypothetical protein
LAVVNDLIENSLDKEAVKMDWKLIKAADFIDFNPRESVPKGAIAKKVAMDQLQPFMRDKAIKSMAGSSGRQRVQQGVMNDTEFLAPPLDEQIEIGRTLRALDDKISNNAAINHHFCLSIRSDANIWRRSRTCLITLLTSGLGITIPLISHLSPIDDLSPISILFYETFVERLRFRARIRRILTRPEGGGVRRKVTRKSFYGGFLRRKGLSLVVRVCPVHF